MLTLIHRKDSQGQPRVLFLHSVPGLLHRLHVQPLWQLQDRAGQVPACLTPLPGKTQPAQRRSYLHTCVPMQALSISIFNVFGLAPPVCNIRQKHSTLHAPRQRCSKASDCRHQAMC